MKLLRAVLLAVMTLGLVVVALPASAAAIKTGAYVPTSPARVLDTRTGLGAAKKPIGPKGTVQVQISGRGGIPASGVSAVVANVTVVSPSAGMWLAIYPTGQNRPVGSSINVAAGKVRANQITVALGTGGKIAVYNSAGDSNVVLDVVGYYLAGETGADGTGFAPLEPTRALDTRNDGGGPLGPGDAAPVGVTLNSEDDPDANASVRALAVNLTVTGATTAGFLNAWDGTGNPPSTSAINFNARQTVANTAIVRTQACGESCPGAEDAPIFLVLNRAAGNTNVIADVVGAYVVDEENQALRFEPLPTPRRVVDTRTGLGASTFGSNQTKTVDPASVISDDTEAVVTNVTLLAGTQPTFAAMWPEGDRPLASNVNADARENAANGATVGLATDGTFQAFNKQGPANLLVDVVGRFDYQGEVAQARAQSTRAVQTAERVTVRRGAFADRWSR